MGTLTFLLIQRILLVFLELPRRPLQLPHRLPHLTLPPQTHTLPSPRLLLHVLHRRRPQLPPMAESTEEKMACPSLRKPDLPT
ncbi:hypothetical protein R3P38DRAFT_3168533 [Favolaschia claudopus]|uniref:Uncharacterized protein n=1 Tax=Favolaschia claudopus TaxID=2862362 RepID=A0AAW0DW00_9AGAR